MSRVRFNTTIDEDLLCKARELAISQSLDGANDVIEAALRIYFANCSAVVWEKHLSGGWVKKLVVRPGKVTFESIRSRKVFSRFNPSYYTSEVLESKGWKKIWKMKYA